MRSTLRRTGRLVGGSLVAAAAGWAGYAATTWLRYGRRPRAGPRDLLLDRYVPTFDVQERHQIRVAAPADITYDALLSLDILRSPIIRAIFRGREMLLRAKDRGEMTRASLLEQTQAMGWRVLVEEPGREIVIGAITRPWEPVPVFLGLGPDEFVAFNEPGYVKIVWTLAATTIGDATSLARTETRVVTTDALARRKFRRYWSIFSPGILLIRKESLRLVRAHAERNYRARRTA